MQRIRLKRKTKVNIKKNIFIFVILFLIILSFFIIDCIGKKIGDKLLKYAEVEVSRIAKYVVNYAVTTKNIENLEFNNLFIVTRNSQEEIQTVDFDPIVVNNILNSITETVIAHFKALEQGNLDTIDLSHSILFDVDINKLKKGIVAEVPIGVITENSLLSNLGPRLPVKLSILGEIESQLETEVKHYGINNALITVYVNIKVSEQIYMPIVTGKVDINQKIPIAIKLMNGVVPNTYFGNMDSAILID